MSIDNVITVDIESIIYREDLYPRVEADSPTITKYAEDIEVLPPVEINQHNILIDGFHRWKAHVKCELPTIQATVTQTESDSHIFRLAIERNKSHGRQMSLADKRKSARRLYDRGEGLSKSDLASVLSVSEKSIDRYLSDIDKDLRSERKEKIAAMWMACYTQEEIAEAVGVTQQSIDQSTKELQILDTCPKLVIIQAQHADEQYEAPLFNVWAFGKKTNTTSHFGNSEQRIVDNLLYLYTQPFDIVLDPFAGGGSTIDVCKKRSRRYWVSDRKPIVERETEIRKHDIATDGLPPLHKRWQDVTLTYLDPPYWRQAEGKYSTDATDLANMPLDEFTDTLVNLVHGVAEKQKSGYIALLIQPTQWKSDDKKFTDHVMHLCSAVNLTLENRVSCPYQTEQYNAQQVSWAKANKSLLVISRELIVWRI